MQDVKSVIRTVAQIGPLLIALFLASAIALAVYIPVMVVLLCGLVIKPLGRSIVATAIHAQQRVIQQGIHMVMTPRTHN